VREKTSYNIKAGFMGNPRLRTLLIDDDESAYLIIRRLLSKVPNKTFELEWASTFDAGLKTMLEKQHDVCLLDYHLGIANGLDLLRKAISMGVKTPIIILTGVDDPRVDTEAANIGASDFLQKDQLTPVLLERSIRYALQHFATLNALQKSHDRFRLLFERSMDAILITDDQGHFVEVNGAACALLGMPKERLQQMRWQELFTSATLPNGPREDGLNEISITCPNGERRLIEFSVSQLAADLNLNILRDITEQRNLEREIQQISEREQRRLGQDLHDGLGQALTGIAFMAKVLEQRLQSKNSEDSAQAGEISKLLNEALMQTRNLSRGLCPVVLETNDIEAALLQLGSNLRTFFGITCTVKVDAKVRISDNAVAIHLYRIAQEATTNAIKHGKAKKIEIELFAEGCRLILRIRDDGVGIQKVDSTNKGMGLRVMHHRARMIGGAVSIRKEKDGGTTVICTLRKSLATKKHGDTEIFQKHGAPLDRKPQRLVCTKE
jgi:PAS domain S-box-containing protein